MNTDKSKMISIGRNFSNFGFIFYDVFLWYQGVKER